ncbi:uncharacterized protein CLUP02_10344 [Colletotrichum lupini]|uniref:Uncharacterized protein n=1 Tax=Colletotrichum lupini TaxID=145971 RepID=A0A9Q8WIG2_9PEZI|nr:uncharacterized protein CLUP02_10344 [Colletotrichum lupini]UQC84848.1 hypothetical protein CLUP02_10344 [Colletotrichum lupini]
MSIGFCQLRHGVRSTCDVQQDTKLLIEGSALPQDMKTVPHMPFCLQQDCVSTTEDITTPCLFNLFSLMYSPCELPQKPRKMSRPNLRTLLPSKPKSRMSERYRTLDEVAPRTLVMAIRPISQPLVHPQQMLAPL